MQVAGEASTGEETLNLLGKSQADVLLMDVFMPGMGFLEVLRRVRMIRPTLPTLVVSMQPEEQCALRAFRAGASGYLAKDRSLDQVVGAVRTVAEGRKYFSPELAERMVSSLSTPAARLPHVCFPFLAGRAGQRFVEDGFLGHGRTPPIDSMRSKSQPRPRVSAETQASFPHGFRQNFDRRPAFARQLISRCSHARA